MKFAWGIAVLFCTLPTLRAESLGVYQHGTVVRMQMADCLAHRGFAAVMGGQPAQQVTEPCPEYTLVSDKVVFVIVGKSSGQVIPLADVIDFRLHGHELAVRIDDARHESRFHIKEMVLRSQWDLVQKHIEGELSATLRRAHWRRQHAKPKCSGCSSCRIPLPRAFDQASPARTPTTAEHLIHPHRLDARSRTCPVAGNNRSPSGDRFSLAVTSPGSIGDPVKRH